MLHVISGLPTSQKSSSFSVRRLVIPPEVAPDRPFQTTLPFGGKDNAVLQKSKKNKNVPNHRWALSLSEPQKSYKSFDSSMRVATRYYTTTNGLKPHTPPNLNVFQCLK
jgi:hypothetical protein